MHTNEFCESYKRMKAKVSRSTCIKEVEVEENETSKEKVFGLEEMRDTSAAATC